MCSLHVFSLKGRLHWTFHQKVHLAVHGICAPQALPYNASSYTIMFGKVSAFHLNIFLLDLTEPYIF